jgi:bifunctional DNA-binding transcriptional regulator/antitoxin component of YhaV-PrlF toxin-antitoxin module
MSHVVGLKGQVVIEKDIRDRLGVRAGWIAVQSLVGDRVEMRFLPPEHNRSLFACLAQYVKRPAPTDEQINQAVAAGIAADYVRELHGEDSEE